MLNRTFATRVVYSILRGISRDRLDLLGDEYFEYKLKPQLKPDGVAQLRKPVSSGAEVVLVSQGLEYVMRPLAQHLVVKWIISLTAWIFATELRPDAFSIPSFVRVVFLPASHQSGGPDGTPLCSAAYP